MDIERRCACNKILRIRHQHVGRRVRCPECGRRASRIISGGAGLIFKGSGFYITDYGKDGKGPAKPETEARTETTASGSEAPNPEKTSPEKSDKPGKNSSKKKASS